MKQLISISIFIFLCFGCSKDGSEPTEVKYQKKEFSKTFGDCSGESTNCVNVKVSYVEFTAAANQMILDSLNNTVKKSILASVFETEYNTLEELAGELIKEYESLKKDFPDSPVRFELERKIEILPGLPGLLTIQFSEYSYLGGAHPNGVVLFSNIDTQTGRTVRLEDLFVDKFKDTLTKIAEKRFRVIRNLKPDDDLSEAGFYFENNKFYINDNFAITKGGLRFYFNDYEVAPHVLGPTEFEIPYSELESIIKPNGKLAIR